MTRTRSFVSLFVVIGVVALGVPAAHAAPANDDFQDAQVIRIGANVEGSVRGATTQPGEPGHGHAYSDTEHSVWYRLRARRRATLRVHMCSDHADYPLLAVYSGSSLRSLAQVDRKIGDDGPREGCAEVMFTARRGRRYWIAVGNFGGNWPFRLTVRRWPAPANDDFAEAIPVTLGSSIAGTTLHATRELGEPLSRGVGGRATVWYRFTVARAMPVQLGACNGHRPAAAIYRGGRVRELALVAAMHRCLVRFRAHPGVTYRVRLFSRRSAAGGFRLVARTGRPPPNDYFADATPITVGTTISATTRGASLEPREPTGISPPGPYSVWFRLSVPRSMRVRICPRSEYIEIFTGEQLGGLEFFGHPNNATAACGDNSQLGRESDLQPGVSYSIRVGSQLEEDFTLSVHLIGLLP